MIEYEDGKKFVRDMKVGSNSEEREEEVGGRGKG